MPAVPAVPAASAAAGREPPWPPDSSPLTLLHLCRPRLAAIPRRDRIAAGGGGRLQLPAGPEEGVPGRLSLARGRRAMKQSAMRRG